MGKETVIKALECCYKDDCDNCPNNFGNCYSNLAKDALALIKEQEQKIKELTEECENYKSIAEYQQNCNMDRGFKIKRLTEENERLKEKADRHLDNLKAVLEERSENTIVADTVREMQERFKELMGGEIATCGYCNAVGYWSVKAVKDNIDRIANEILNENTEECTDCKHFVGCEPSTLGVCDMYEEDEKE